MLRDKASTATEEELSAIQEFIDSHYEEKVNEVERLWNMLQIDKAQSESDLERQYIGE